MNIFKILKDDEKLKIVLLLMNGEHCVCDLEKMLDIKQSCLSNKLKVLKDNDIIKVRKQKNWNYYKLNQHFYEDNLKLMEYIVEKNNFEFESSMIREENGRK